MKVELISFTPNPLKVLWVAARNCYSSKKPTELWNENDSKENIINFLRKLYERGHLSVFEHVYFTFAIEGISRACSHQLVRHRIASYSQKSQRHTKVSDFVIPKSCKNESEINQFLEESLNLYEKLINIGIPLEDARYFIPNAATTDLVMTINLRSFMNLCNERLCNRAQWEIRKLTKKMRDEVIKKTGIPERFLVSKCEKLGYCPEGVYCRFK